MNAQQPYVPVRRLLALLAGFWLLIATAEAETVLNQGLMSSAIFRKMRAVQAQIHAGQYADALTQLGYLQGVAGSNYETAAVRELTADLYIARGDYSSALANLAPVVQQTVLPPTEQRAAQLTLAKLYVSNGQYQEGLDMLRTWLNGVENPPPDVLITMAQAYAQTGQCRQATPYAKRAIDASPEAPQEWYQLWVACLYDTRDYTDAADALQALLSRFPDQTQYWQQLGEAYAQMGDLSRAVGVYSLMRRQGLIRQPQDYLNLASLYLQNSEPFQAAQVLQEGLQANVLPATEANYDLLASAWIAAAETDRAVAALTEASKTAKDGEPYLAQAQLYLSRQDWGSAIDTAKKALAKGSLRRPGRAWLLQAIADIQSLHFDDATAALREAVKYDDSRAQAELWQQYLSKRNGVS